MNRFLIRTAPFVFVASLVLFGCSPANGPDTENGSVNDSEQTRTQSQENENMEESMDSTEEEMSTSEEEPHPALYDPSQADETAPDTFRVRFETTEGDFTVRFHRDWSPNGADRVYNLVKIGYYTDIAFFRVIDGFMAQFGYHGDPEVNEAWGDATIPDDAVKKSNKRGFVTFAKTRRPNSRTVQLFINYKDNSGLDRQGFAPVGKVTEGMDVVDSLYAGYGEGAPRGNGPSQGKIARRGNEYLEEEFPKLDYIEETVLLDE